MSQICSGLDKQDTTECVPCLTSCPNQTHYYLKGDCILEKSSCELCDPPCDPALFTTVRECANNLNRICRAKTLCGQQCPPGYYTNGQCLDGAQVCIKCSSCKAGDYASVPCSSTGNTQCLECTKQCLVSPGNNGIMGSCSSGTDLQDAVQCISSSSPVGLPCAANEWLSASLSEYAISTEAVGSPLDDGTPSDSMDFFKSDFVMEESGSGIIKAVYLGSVKASDSKRSIVKIVHGSTLIGFVLPRDAYYSRLDSRGVDKTQNGPYPTASFSYWDALDVMFSWDTSSIYIFFSWTYDFIAKCNVQPGAIGSASCSYLSTVQFNGTANTPFFSYVGCTKTTASLKSLICAYSAANSYAVVFHVSETDGSKRELLGFGYPGLKNPLSPPAFESASGMAYIICEVSSRIGVLAMNPSSSIRNSATMISSFPDASLPLVYHTLVFLPSRTGNEAGKQLVAANATSIMSLTGAVFDRRSSRELDAQGRSIKDLAAFSSSGQLYVLLHSKRAWHLYTHCAPCPANSKSPAGLVDVGIQRACLCADDFYGSITRPVVDTCRQCRNTGNSSSGDLLRNACPTHMYKTNERCTGGTAVDTTCKPCIQICSKGVEALYPGQFITAICDGTGSLNSVQCQDCASFCPADDVYMDPKVVCSGTAMYDERLASGCRQCRPGGCGSGKYISNRCLQVNRPTQDSTDCRDCSACLMDQYVSMPCNGSTFVDTRQCSGCR